MGKDSGLQKIIVGILIVVGIGFGVNARYVRSRGDLLTLLNRCQFEADKIFAPEMVKWNEQHLAIARQQATFMEACVKKEGWCSVAGSDDSIWPATRSWEFVPRDSLARWIYDLRYWEGEHIGCSD